MLPVQYDIANQRFRSFADSCIILEEVQWPDNPVKGPCSVVWCCRFIKENAGTPNQWHLRWMGLCKLQSSDGGVALHEVACRTLELMLCYDQLSLGTLASAEYLCRQIQIQEHRWRERALGQMGELHLESNLWSGQLNRANLCIAPQLQEWVAEESRKESAVLKEQRKAREERAFAKPK